MINGLHLLTNGPQFYLMVIFGIVISCARPQFFDQIKMGMSADY